MSWYTELPSSQSFIYSNCSPKNAHQAPSRHQRQRQGGEKDATVPMGIYLPGHLVPDIKIKGLDKNLPKPLTT